MAADLDLSRLTELQRVLGSSVPVIIGRLVTEIDGSLAQVEQAIADGDLVAAAHGAHAARNSALMLDARPMLDALGEIESSARAADHSRAVTGLERLRSVWPECRRALVDEATRLNQKESGAA